MKNNLIDMTGQTIGHITFVRYAGDCKWLCKCSYNGPRCRKEFICDSSSVRNGDTRSCGCLRHETAFRVGVLSSRPHKDKNLSGTTIGQVTFIEYVGDGKYRARCNYNLPGCRGDFITHSCPSYIVKSCGCWDKYRLSVKSLSPQDLARLEKARQAWREAGGEQYVSLAGRRNRGRTLRRLWQTPGFLEDLLKVRVGTYTCKLSPIEVRAIVHLRRKDNLSYLMLGEYFNVDATTALVICNDVSRKDITSIPPATREEAVQVALLVSKIRMKIALKYKREYKENNENVTCND